MSAAAGRMTLGVLLASAAIALGAISRQTGEEWQTFEGSWDAAGERQALSIGDGRSAATIRLSGSLFLTRNGGLRRGFRAEALGFDDGSGTGVGRALWTDDRGDQIFSEIVGQPAGTGRRIEGTITGGTGRYTGVTGSYSFEWRYVLPADEIRFQAQSVNVAGRYHLPSPR
jgi:hypothetical protein